MCGTHGGCLNHVVYSSPMFVTLCMCFSPWLAPLISAPPESSYRKTLLIMSDYTIAGVMLLLLTVKRYAKVRNSFMNTFVYEDHKHNCLHDAV